MSMDIKTMQVLLCKPKTYIRVVLYVQIADFFQSGEAHPEEFAIGLQNEFKPLEGCDIGQFPGLESTKQINEDRAYQLVS